MPQIYIKTITNRKQAYNYENDDLIRTIKEAVEHKEGLAQDQFKLIFGGKHLQEDVKIMDAGIKPGDTIHMIMILRGGQSNWFVYSYDQDPSYAFKLAKYYQSMRGGPEWIWTVMYNLDVAMILDLPILLIGIEAINLKA